MAVLFINSTPSEVSAIPCVLSGNPLRALFLKNRDFFSYGEIFVPNTRGPLGCLLGFWPSGPFKFMSNHCKQINYNISLLLRLWMYEKCSKRFCQRITIISPQQISDITSVCLFFHHHCKALDCELWLMSSNCLNHCSGGSAITFLKPGFYFENVVAEIFSYDHIISSSFNACIQMFKDILRQFRVIIDKT